MIYRLGGENAIFWVSVRTQEIGFQKPLRAFGGQYGLRGVKSGAAAGYVHGALTGMRVELPGELNYARLGLVVSRLEPARLYGSVRFWHSHIEGWFSCFLLPGLRRWFNH